MLRRLGYKNPLTIVSADDSAPYDRPNLSKDYLAGTAPEDWMPLRPPEFYAERRIDLIEDALGHRIEVHRRFEKLDALFIAFLYFALIVEALRLV